MRVPVPVFHPERGDCELGGGEDHHMVTRVRWTHVATAFLCVSWLCGCVDLSRRSDAPRNPSIRPLNLKTCRVHLPRFLPQPTLFDSWGCRCICPPGVDDRVRVVGWGNGSLISRMLEPRWTHLVAALVCVYWLCGPVQRPPPPSLGRDINRKRKIISADDPRVAHSFSATSPGENAFHDDAGLSCVCPPGVGWRGAEW